MKNHGAVKFLGVILVLGLIASPMPSHAESLNIKAPAKKKQKFKLKQKATFNFDKKFGSENKPSFGDKIKMKAGKDPKGKKKPAAVFNFGAPIEQANGGHTVSVELVSLSLTSVSQVSLSPFGKDYSGERGKITLSLFQTPNQPRPNPKTGAKVKKLDEQKKKGKKKFSDLKKSLKVSTKKTDANGNKKKKKKELSPLKFAALDIPFTYASPITVSDPGFCMENSLAGADGSASSGAKICLAPMVNPVPIPGALGLFGIGLISLLMVKLGYRRKAGAMLPA